MLSRHRSVSQWVGAEFLMLLLCLKMPDATIVKEDLYSASMSKKSERGTHR